VRVVQQQQRFTRLRIAQFDAIGIARRDVRDAAANALLRQSFVREREQGLERLRRKAANSKSHG
jgi:hypothetical protein